MADKTYVVVAALAIVRNPEQGNRQEYLYQGAPVPDYVGADDLKRLEEEKFIASTSVAEKAGVTPISTPSDLAADAAAVDSAESKKAPAKATASS